MNSVVLKGESLCHLQTFGLLLRLFFIGQGNESASVEPVIISVVFGADKKSSHALTYTH